MGPDWEAFAGAWRIGRKIRDFRENESGRLLGTAAFIPGLKAYRYEETGKLELPGRLAVEARRIYLWEYDGEGVDVRFEDGRVFHRFELGAKTVRTAHWCDPDAYKAIYDFSRWPLWQVEWRVTGPRKDYLMVTEFSRER